MSIKILTKNNVANTNIDGARDNNFSAGMRSGIVKGSLNEGNVFSPSLNRISLDTCVLLLSGHEIIIDEAETIELLSTPAESTRYSLAAEIRVTDDSVPNFRLFYQSVNEAFIQENLFKDIKGKGLYQLEIAKFTINSDGSITDIVRTADLITGGSGTGDGAFNIGNVRTITLDNTQNAEVDIEQRVDEQTKETLTDFTFSIPRMQGPQGPQGPKGDTGAKGDPGKDGTSIIYDGGIEYPLSRVTLKLEGTTLTIIGG